jgi:hypothetical protein
VLFVGGVQRQNVGLLKAHPWHFIIFKSSRNEEDIIV